MRSMSRVKKASLHTDSYIYLFLCREIIYIPSTYGEQTDTPVDLALQFAENVPSKKTPRASHMLYTMHLPSVHTMVL
jgi:hypothetical protein